MSDKISNQNKARNTHNCIFSNEKDNMGHQPEFDYFKALLVFMMVFVHFYENFSRDSITLTVEIIGFILGADGFMLLMGIGMKYSRHQELSNYISRGINLITKGQISNLLRCALPNIIAWKTTGNKIFISRALVFLQPDILTFAGISFLFLALLKKIKLSDNFILCISIIMNIIGFILYKIIKQPESFLMKQLMGYFILTDTEASFPLCSYFIFVAIGYRLGEIYQKISNKDKFYNRIIFFFLPLTIFYIYIRINYNFIILPDFGYDEDYSLFPVPDAINACMESIVIISLLYKIGKIFQGKVPYYIKHLSKNVNKYYIIHYILLLQLTTFLRATKGDSFPSKMQYPTLYGFAILIMTKITIDLNDKYIHFTLTNLKTNEKIVLYPLIWIVTIISVCYIYPKVETYTTFWNNYLYEE
jgi:hypothetical protein